MDLSGVCSCTNTINEDPSLRVGALVLCNAFMWANACISVLHISQWRMGATVGRRRRLGPDHAGLPPRLP